MRKKTSLPSISSPTLCEKLRKHSVTTRLNFNAYLAKCLFLCILMSSVSMTTSCGSLKLHEEGTHTLDYEKSEYIVNNGVSKSYKYTKSKSREVSYKAPQY
ncbi:hypothetical protein [Microvirus mar23]|uniref:Uncharacterized protein n=1 Tax=Microvirus mar23 TaxID=2851156 RepID=A0A8F5MLM2_9VIRU|nr:hypothetical protein [Microvirus mar23]